MNRAGSRTRAAVNDEILLDAVSALLDVTPSVMQRGRSLLVLLGDPGRRTVLERLARRPQRPSDTLPGITGMNGSDIYHRLRSLRRGAVAVRDRRHIYSVDPDVFHCASRYIDAVMATISLTHGRRFQ